MRQQDLVEQFGSAIERSLEVMPGAEGIDAKLGPAEATPIQPRDQADGGARAR